MGAWKRVFVFAHHARRGHAVVWRERWWLLVTALQALQLVSLTFDSRFPDTDSIDALLLVPLLTSYKAYLAVFLTGALALFALAVFCLYLESEQLVSKWSHALSAIFNVLTTVAAVPLLLLLLRGANCPVMADLTSAPESCTSLLSVLIIVLSVLLGLVLAALLALASVLWVEDQPDRVMAARTTSLRPMLLTTAACAVHVATERAHTTRAVLLMLIFAYLFLDHVYYVRGFNQRIYAVKGAGYFTALACAMWSLAVHAGSLDASTHGTALLAALAGMFLVGALVSMLTVWVVPRVPTTTRHAVMCVQKALWRDHFSDEALETSLAILDDFSSAHATKMTMQVRLLHVAVLMVRDSFFDASRALSHLVNAKREMRVIVAGGHAAHAAHAAQVAAAPSSSSSSSSSHEHVPLHRVVQTLAMRYQLYYMKRRRVRMLAARYGEACDEHQSMLHNAVKAHKHLKRSVVLMWRAVTMGHVTGDVTKRAQRLKHADQVAEREFRRLLEYFPHSLEGMHEYGEFLMHTRLEVQRGRALLAASSGNEGGSASGSQISGLSGQSGGDYASTEASTAHHSIASSMHMGMGMGMSSTLSSRASSMFGRSQTTNSIGEGSIGERMSFSSHGEAAEQELELCKVHKARVKDLHVRLLRKLVLRGLTTVLMLVTLSVVSILLFQSAVQEDSRNLDVVNKMGLVRFHATQGAVLSNALLEEGADVAAIRAKIVQSVDYLWRQFLWVQTERQSVVTPGAIYRLNNTMFGGVVEDVPFAELSTHYITHLERVSVGEDMAELADEILFTALNVISFVDAWDDFVGAVEEDADDAVDDSIVEASILLSISVVLVCAVVVLVVLPLLNLVQKQTHNVLSLLTSVPHAFQARIVSHHTRRLGRKRRRRRRQAGKSYVGSVSVSLDGTVAPPPIGVVDTSEDTREAGGSTSKVSVGNSLNESYIEEVSEVTGTSTMRSFHVRVGLVVAAFLVLFVISFALRLSHTSDIESGPEHINLNGRQRMLTKRIWFLADQLSHRRLPDAAAELNRALDEYMSAHMRLVLGNDGFHDPFVIDHTLNALMFTEVFTFHFHGTEQTFVGLHNAIMYYVEVGREVLSAEHRGDAHGVNTGRDILEALADAGGVVVEGQKRAVLLNVQRFQAKLDQGDDLQLALEVLFLVVLVLSMMLVLLPLMLHVFSESRTAGLLLLSIPPPVAARVKEVKAYMLQGVNVTTASEESIKMSERHTHSILEASLDPMALFDSTNRCSEFNVAAQEMLGYDRMDVIGSDVRDFFTNAIDLSALVGKSTALSARAASGDEVPVLLNVTSLSYTAGEFVYVLVMRNMAAEQEERTRQVAIEILRSSPEPILSVASDGKIISANAATCALLGTSVDALEGTPFTNHVAALTDDSMNVIDEAVSDEELLEEIVEQGSRGLCMRHYSDAAGAHHGGEHAGDEANLVYVRASVGTVSTLATGGQESTFTVVLHDLTAEREARHSREAQERALAESEAKSAFLANMSHEIRTPLNGILGINQVLLSSGDELSLDQRHEYCGIIQQSANNLLGIISDILDLNKIASGKLELESIPFDMELLAESAVRSMAITAQKKNLDMGVFVHPDARTAVEGDQVRLKQCVINLIGNAIKFTSVGNVNVTVHMDGLYERADGQRESMYEIRVTDTGIGLKPEQVDKLWDRFTQADTSTTRKFGGTGLGLSITKDLVEMMGGSIAVESAYGEGSSFIIRVPLLVRVCEDDTSRFTALREEKTVSIIHPVSIVSAPLQEYLSRMGAKCVVAASPADLDALPDEERAFDIVMCDIDLHTKVRPLYRAKNEVLLTPLGFVVPPGSAASTYLAVPSTRKAMQDLLLRLCSGRPPVPPRHPLLRKQVRSRSFTSDKKIPILVAEDDRVNQRVISLLLRKHFTVTIVENGQEAVDEMAQHGSTYSALICDHMMPIMDGFEATARIRASEGDNEHIPIVALTAGAMEADRRRALEAGCDAFLTKPIVRAELFDELCKWVPDLRRRLGRPD